jgi:hypothetical protein
MDEFLEHLSMHIHEASLLDERGLFGFSRDFFSHTHSLTSIPDILFSCDTELNYVIIEFSLKGFSIIKFIAK